MVLIFVDVHGLLVAMIFVWCCFFSLFVVRSGLAVMVWIVWVRWMVRALRLIWPALALVLHAPPRSLITPTTPSDPCVCPFSATPLRSTSPPPHPHPHNHNPLTALHCHRQLAALVMWRSLSARATRMAAVPPVWQHEAQHAAAVAATAASASAAAAIQGVHGAVPSRSMSLRAMPTVASAAAHAPASTTVGALSRGQSASSSPDNDSNPLAVEAHLARLEADEHGRQSLALLALTEETAKWAHTLQLDTAESHSEQTSARIDEVCANTRTRQRMFEACTSQRSARLSACGCALFTMVHLDVLCCCCG